MVTGKQFCCMKHTSNVTNHLVKMHRDHPVAVLVADRSAKANSVQLSKTSEEIASFLGKRKSETECRRKDSEYSKQKI